MSYRVAQRWTETGRSLDGFWCIIEDGLAYAYSSNPFGIDTWIAELNGRTVKAWGGRSSPELTRRSPVGTNEEEWLSQNDTNHPEYPGV